MQSLRKKQPVPRPKRKFPCNMTLDRELVRLFKYEAFHAGMSLSCYVEQLMRAHAQEIKDRKSA